MSQWRLFATVTISLSMGSFLTVVDQTWQWYAWRFAFLSLSTSCLVAYLSALLVEATHSRLLKGLFFAAALLLLTVVLFLRWQFSTIISASVIRLLVETNASECHDFLVTYLLGKASWRILVIYALLFGGLYLVPKTPAIRYLVARFPRLKCRLSSAALFLSLCGLYSLPLTLGFYKCHDFLSLSKWEDTLRLGSYDNALYHTLFALHSIEILERETLASHHMTARVLHSPCSTDEDSLFVVLIIGESHIKSHSAIYGYPLMTTPQCLALQKSGNLYAFQDAISTRNLTAEALQSMLSTNALPHEPWYSGAFLPAVFRRAGFEVSFWDNQRTFAPDLFFSLGLNAFLYSPINLQKVYNRVNSRSFPYDLSLVNDYISKGLPRSPLSFVMFHLMGQHFATSERFPHIPPFLRFHADDYQWLSLPWLNDTKRSLMASMDNATLYNDYVLSRIFSIFKEKNAVAVYLSDHGEEVYDWRNSQGRVLSSDNPPLFLHSQIDIPLYIYVSSKYRALHPALVSRLPTASRQPFTSNDLPHLLFSLASLHTPFYDPSRSPLSPSFRPRPRYLVTGECYDTLIKQPSPH